MEKKEKHFDNKVRIEVVFTNQILPYEKYGLMKRHIFIAPRILDIQYEDLLFCKDYKTGMQVVDFPSGINPSFDDIDYDAIKEIHVMKVIREAKTYIVRKPHRTIEEQVSGCVWEKELNRKSLIRFGKYEGCTIDHLMFVNQGYLKWCTENVKGFNLEKDLLDSIMENTRKRRHRANIDYNAGLEDQEDKYGMGWGSGVLSVYDASDFF